MGFEPEEIKMLSRKGDKLDEAIREYVAFRAQERRAAAAPIQIQEPKLFSDLPVECLRDIRSYLTTVPGLRKKIYGSAAPDVIGFF